MIKNGIDCIDGYDSLFHGKRLGLITSITGLTAGFETTIQVLHRKYGLSAMFSPEHGVRGDIAPGALVDTYTDEETGIPVYSLYRKDSKRLTPEMLDAVDMIVYDIQDVGSRYYTYLYTMLYALEDCAKAGKEFVILDRINPLGDRVEGNVLREGYESFVGGYPLAMRYGLTIGEFARMADDCLKLHARLTVIPVEGWRRDMLYPDTGRCWIAPSMGLPSFATAFLYPGLCLFEGTNLSEGRGTTGPFETIGAPFIDAQKLTAAMQKKGLAGVAFTPAYFIPTTSKWNGEACQGVRIHVTDARQASPVEVGLTLLYEIMERYGEKAYFLPAVRDGGRQFIELLCGSDVLTKQKKTLTVLLEEFAEESREFAKRKREYQIYQ
ncbi:MAG: DUF1343 domain-containing protein [Lachnospiraceae bacterium]|jgi:uncharacterized protein YbbC (DUF1343 family)|nr:DUF1343 domain-containing protein [Lachnospiraceae bacterium]